MKFCEARTVDFFSHRGRRGHGGGWRPRRVALLCGGRV